MDSPVARIFGIDSSVVAISIGYTATEPSESPVSAFFGEISETRMTIPMDRARLLTKLRPGKPTVERSGKKLGKDSFEIKNHPSLTNQNADRVEMTLQDFASMMQDAADTDRAWVKDFKDDQLAIPRDLYEVMLAYQQMRRAG